MDIAGGGPYAPTLALIYGCYEVSFTVYQEAADGLSVDRYFAHTGRKIVLADRVHVYENVPLAGGQYAPRTVPARPDVAFDGDVLRWRIFV